MLDSSLSYDIKITLKLHFWLENIKILPLNVVIIQVFP